MCVNTTLALRNIIQTSMERINYLVIDDICPVSGKNMEIFFDWILKLETVADILTKI